MRIFKKKEKDVSNTGDFYSMLEENRGKGCTIKVFEMSGIHQNSKGNFPLEILLDTQGEIEDLIYAEYGNGTYQLVLQNNKRYQLATYNVSIARGKTPKSDSEAKGQSSPYPNLGAIMGQLTPLLTPVFGMFEKMMEKMMSGNGNKDNSEAIIQAIKIGQESGFPKEILYTLMNNAMNSGGDPLETYERINNLVRSNVPNVEQDGVSQLMSVVTGLVGMSAMKNNPMALAGLLPQQTPVHTGPLPPGNRPDPVSGLASNIPQASNPVPQQRIEQPTTNSQHPELTRHELFLKSFIQPFMESIERQEKPENLAIMLYQMFQYSIIQMKDDPHPLIAPFLENTDIQSLDRSFDQFAASIPNLANKPMLKSQIKIELVKLFSGVDIGEDEEEIETAGEPESQKAGEPEIQTTGEVLNADINNQADEGDPS